MLTGKSTGATLMHRSFYANHHKPEGGRMDESLANHDEVHDEINRHVTAEEFRQKFNFGKHIPGTVSVRRSRFVVNQDMELSEFGGQEFLKKLAVDFPMPQFEKMWFHGLSYFQLNHKTAFVRHRKNRALEEQMYAGNDVASLILQRLGMDFCYVELNDQDIPKNFLPTPAYAKLSRRFDRSILSHCVQTCSTCVEIAMPNLEAAIHGSNLIRSHIERFAKFTSSQRKKYWDRLMTITGKRPIPEHYDGFEHFYQEALHDGFASDPTMAPHVANISPEGTLRMDFFGNRKEIEPVLRWVDEVMVILSPALES
jgi:hypothetical protein